MSGICGIVSLGGAPPDEGAIDGLLEPLKRRGPDGTGTWIGDDVAFGHALLATTPEALVERLPLHDPDSACAITADVRLDNRDELIDELGLGRQGKVLGDGELILRAYLKWGEHCPNHLLGDFALAIWDARRQRLFCARDQMGMRQLAYCYLPGAAFVFATEPGAVVRHPLVPRSLNEGRIADFLDDLESLDLTATFYTDVWRLPPAHRLTLDQLGLRVSKYWQLRTPSELRLRRDEEYSEAFIHVFESALRSRLRSPGPVGAMLSGGMDSGTVVALAADILAAEGREPLKTISGVGPDSDLCVETRAIHAAARIHGIDPLFLSYAGLDPMRDDLVKLTMESADPFARLLAIERAIFLAAHRLGLKVVLDGVAGDAVFSAPSHTALLLRRGRLIAGIREAAGESRYWGAQWNFWKAFGTAAGRAWVPRALRRARRRAAWRLEDSRIGRFGLISSAFAAEAQVRDRRHQLRTRDSTFENLDKEERARRVEHAHIVIAREHYDSVASAVAVEPRDPFLDLRVVEFGLSLPTSQLQSGGWPKILLRRAMEGRLPDAVRWRRGKQHLGWEFVKKVASALPPPGIEEFHATIGRYIDLGSFPPSAGKDGPVEHCKEWIDAICLFYWLDSAGRSLRR